MYPQRRALGDNAGADQIYTRRDAWFAVLADDFGIHFDASSSEAVDRLWERVLASHRDWEAKR